jgi:membrane glycosyltransferase
MTRRRKVLSDGFYLEDAAHSPIGVGVSAAFLRRAVFCFLVSATTLGLAGWLAVIVAANGFRIVDSILVLCFATKALWIALVFWSSAVGFALRRVVKDRLLNVLGAKAPHCDDSAITVCTAIVMAVRDEDAKRVCHRLECVQASLNAAGHGAKFHYFLLSDSTRSDVIAAEEREIAKLRQRRPEMRLVYRRRNSNSDFKAGNLRDFCHRWGDHYEFMIVLDADSVMSGEAILRLVRIMQARPRLAILQSLIDCVWPMTAAARPFEFGHRLVWHNYILGSAWWQGERGQYRGHNAAVRIKPYVAHARLAEGDGVEQPSSHVMCSDQVEAALLHRAGYEVREFPVAGGSYEGLPPAVPDFIARYRRWVQGNLKNLRLLRVPGLALMDLYHFAGVAHRFLGWPAFVLFVSLAAYASASWPAEVPFPSTSAAALYSTFMALYFAPIAFGVTDAALSGANRYGGMVRLGTGAAIAIVFIVLFVPIAMIGITWFMIELLAGRRSVWAPQPRSNYRLSWADAARALWVQTGFGFALTIALALAASQALPWFLPYLIGPMLAIPFAVLTSAPQATALMERLHLCALPEEIVPPAELAELRRLEQTDE